MLLGLMSDSHGRAMMVRNALTLFDSLGVDRIIHCGDVGGENVFDELVGRDVAFVWGNTDDPHGGIETYLRTVGIPPPQAPPLRLDCVNKRIAVFHGHEPGFASAVRHLDVDYLFHGHTHQCRDEHVGGKRIINPGALHRASPKTVATLDLVTDHVTFHEIAGHER